MSSKQRVRPVIELIDPDGKVFIAKWIGDKRTVEKKVALFDFVGVQGTVAQNLRSKSRRYPLTFMFDGPDHDLDAQDFFDSFDNKDDVVWTIHHPTKGTMDLQPLSCSEGIQPVKTASHTEFNTEWLEPIDPETLLTYAQLAALQGNNLNVFNEACSEQFDNNVSLDTEAESEAVRAESKNMLEKVVAATSSLSSQITEVQERVNATQLALESVLDAVILEPLVIAALMQQLIQTPSLVATSVQSRLQYYKGLADEILGRENDSNDSVARNRSAVKELGATAIIGAYSNIGFTGSRPGSSNVGEQASTGGVLSISSVQLSSSLSTIQTKDTLLKIMDDIDSQTKEIIDGLDADQLKYRDLQLQWQYFSQSSSFTSGWQLILLTLQYLHSAFYSALIEKRFVLKVPQTPIQITLDKYGSLGENDSNLDLLIDSNKLKDDEIYLVPAGREIVIYG